MMIGSGKKREDYINTYKIENNAMIQKCIIASLHFLEQLFSDHKEILE